MTKALKYHLVALVGLQLLLCFLYGYHKMYNQRPFSVHQWRQTDCASFAKNYYEDGMHFFQPQIHWQGNLEGKAVSEFPLINYTVAGLWKIFGEHESLYRLTVLALYLVAMLFLFVMMHAVSDSFLYGYFATSLLTSSPVLAYYSFSFLADVPALSFSIMSLSLFIGFMLHHRKGMFVAAVALATLATLLKASSATVLVIIGIISLINLLRFPAVLAEGKKLFASAWLPVSAFVVSGALIYSWYHFALVYNGGNSNGVFLMETLPVWKMQDKVIETARYLYSVQLAMYFNKGVLIAFALAALWLLLNLKALPAYLRLALLVSAVSFVAFILLFFQVFNVHDYYLITTMIFPVVILLCIGVYLKNSSFPFSGKKLHVMLALIVIVNALHCASVVRMRNIPGDSFARLNPFISNDEKNISDWLHYQYEITTKPMESITPYLRSLGIRRSDPVISAPDPSFNITLYLMDQKGFTATESSLQADSVKVNEYMALGAKYLILSDTGLLSRTNLQRHVGSRIGQYQHIAIYKLY